jgi:hypothetical protein
LTRPTPARNAPSATTLNAETGLPRPASRAGPAASLSTRTTTRPTTSANAAGWRGSAGPSQRPQLSRSPRENRTQPYPSQPVMDRAASPVAHDRVVDRDEPRRLGDHVRGRPGGPAVLPWPELGPASRPSDGAGDSGPARQGGASASEVVAYAAPCRLTAIASR